VSPSSILQEPNRGEPSRSEPRRHIYNEIAGRTDVLEQDLQKRVISRNSAMQWLAMRACRRLCPLVDA
jgi:hypothetical protein